MPTRNEIEKEISGLYLTTIGRAADSAGVAYWVDQVIKGNLTTAQVGQSFFDQAEVKTKYDGLDTSAFVQSVYKNVLGRDADQAGLDYWVNELNGGSFSKDRFIEAVNNGATGDDSARLENMKTVGYYYMKEVGVNSELASKVLQGIDANTDTKGNGIALVDFYKGHVEKLKTATGTSEEDLWGMISDDSKLAQLGVDDSLLQFAQQDNNFWSTSDDNFLESASLWASQGEEYQRYVKNEGSTLDIEKLLSEGIVSDNGMYDIYGTPESGETTTPITPPVTEVPVASDETLKNGTLDLSSLKDYTTVSFYTNISKSHLQHMISAITDSSKNHYFYDESENIDTCAEYGYTNLQDEAFDVKLYSNNENSFCSSENTYATTEVSVQTYDLVVGWL